MPTRDRPARNLVESRADAAASSVARWSFVAGLAVLVVAAFLSRVRAWNPPSLWLDDEWVAALVNWAPVRFLFEARIPCAPGFVLAERAVRSALGEGFWQLQALPFTAGLAQIPLVALLVRRATGSRATALLAAAAIAANSTVAEQSTRVKPFALDGCLAASMLLLALAALRSQRALRLVPLAAVAALAPLLSFPSLIVGAVLVNAAAAVASRASSTSERRRILATCAVADAAMLAVALFVVRGRSNPSLIEYWRDGFLPIDDLAAARAFASGPGAAFFGGAFPDGFSWLGAAIPVGLLILAARRRERALALGATLIFVAVVVASALRRYPMGGGRLDAFSYPISILAAATTIHWIGSRIRLALPALASVAVGWLAWWLPTHPIVYPSSGGRQALESLSAKLESGDALVVFPWMNFAFGAYGRWPVELVPVDDSTNGFWVELDRPQTLVLRETRNGSSFLDQPAVMVDQLTPFLEHASRRLFYVAMQGLRGPHETIVRTLAAAGYSMKQHEMHDGALLFLCER